jgi:hypothetical protein
MSGFGHILSYCFAYEGMKKLGVQNEYECGVIYRIKCWLKELGLKPKINPRIKKCLLTSQGHCGGTIKVSFEKPNNNK